MNQVKNAENHTADDEMSKNDEGILSDQPQAEEAMSEAETEEEELKDRMEREARRERLIKLRKAQRMSQGDVAEKAGISLSTYAELENKNSKRRFREDAFKQIAKLFGTTPQFIMFGEEESAKEEKTEAPNFDDKVNASQLKALIGDICEITDPAVFIKISEYVRDQMMVAEIKQKRS